MMSFLVPARRGFAWIALSLALVMWSVWGTMAVHAADVILLKNGDRVSGDIITMEDTVLTVDTDYADVIKIDWDDVDGLTSDKPLWVSFHEGAVIPTEVVWGLAEASPPGTLTLNPSMPRGI
jgi:hypothetical protein